MNVKKLNSQNQTLVIEAETAFEKELLAEFIRSHNPKVIVMGQNGINLATDPVGDPIFIQKEEK